MILRKMHDYNNKEIKVGKLIKQRIAGFCHDKGTIWFVSAIGFGISDLTQCAVLKSLDSGVVMFATQRDLMNFELKEDFVNE